MPSGFRDLARKTVEFLAGSRLPGWPPVVEESFCGDEAMDPNRRAAYILTRTYAAKVGFHVL